MNSLLICCALLTIVPVAKGQQPPTPEQWLSTRGISLSSEALRAALSDKRPQIAGTAAGVLAEQKDIEAIPAIKSAMARSSNELDRQNFATALMELKDPAGVQELHSICADRKIREDSRVIVASQLTASGDYVCLDSMLDLLAAANESGLRYSLLTYLMQVRTLPLDLRAKAKVGLEKALLDHIAANRELASRWLVRYKFRSAISRLSAALENEKDPKTREALTTALSQLESLKPM